MNNDIKNTNQPTNPMHINQTQLIDLIMCISNPNIAAKLSDDNSMITQIILSHKCDMGNFIEDLKDQITKLEEDDTKPTNTYDRTAEDFIDHEDFDDDYDDYYHDEDDEDDKDISDLEYLEGCISIANDSEFIELLQDMIDKSVKKSSKKMIKKLKNIIEDNKSSTNIDYEYLTKNICDHLGDNIQNIHMDICNRISGSIITINKRITECEEFTNAICSLIKTDLTEYRNEVRELNEKYNKMIELITIMVNNNAESKCDNINEEHEGSSKKDIKKKKSKSKETPSEYTNKN